VSKMIMGRQIKIMKKKRKEGVGGNANIAV
jgi:hypothetical protein